jgi:hypothetical protein
MQEVLRSFELFGKAAGVFLILLALYWVPVTLGDFALYISIADATQYEAANMAFALLCGLLISPLVNGAYFVGLRDVDETGGTDLQRTLGIGMKKFLRVLLAGILLGLAFIVGVILLIIPGILAALYFALVIPIVVYEDISVTDAFKRSAELMKGRKGHLFFIWFALFCASLTAGFLLGFALVFLGEAAELVMYVATLALGTVFGIITGIITYGVLWCFYKRGIEEEQFAENPIPPEDGGPLPVAS